jgi:cytosine/adenosine deaminase-related metal-dependent hydrolase
VTDESGPISCDLLVRNAYVLTIDRERRVYPEGAVAISGREIAAVGPERELVPRFRPKRTIDAHGAVVHPGFVEAHVHVTQHVFRFAFTGASTWADLGAFFTAFHRLVEDEEEHASSLLACLEMARNGTTSFLEGCGSVLEPDAAAAAAEAVGVRASLADPFVWDVPPPNPAAADRIPLDRSRALAVLGTQLKRNRDPTGLVQGHVAVVGHGTVSDELELAAKDCADENGVILNQHQSYMETDTTIDDRRHGGHPLVHYSDLGLLDGNCTFAHMNVLREDELAPIAQSGMSVVWCPTASMIYGVGGTLRGRHVELLDRGVNVALGSDAPNWAGSIDVGEQAFFAMLTAREQTGRGDALEAEDGLVMATINGAKALGWEHRIGSLEPGKLADLVIRRDDLPEAQPGLDPIRAVAYSGRAKSVDTVIVDGEVIVSRGHSTRVDEAAVYERAGAAARGLLDRMGWPIEPRWPLLA